MPIVGPISPEQIARAAGRVAAAARRRRKPDHRSIQERQQRIVAGAMVRFYFYGALAPAWWVPREPDAEQVARARRFAQEFLPDLFAPEPAAADRSGTIFRLTDVADEMDNVALRIAPTGLVEFSWALSAEVDQGGRLLLSAVDIAWLARRLAVAATREPYARISRIGEQRKRRQHLDWCFAITPSVGTPTGQRCWDGLSFPDAEPPRAKHIWATVPAAGYGGSLGERRHAISPDRFAATVLTEHLQENGYHDYEVAVGQTVAAARARDQPPRSSGPLS